MELKVHLDRPGNSLHRGKYMIAYLDTACAEEHTKTHTELSINIENFGEKLSWKQFLVEKKT
jgi:5-carboxymethyl-2-hydroxymuconate isomerase